jgi:putative DNA methylase
MIPKECKRLAEVDFLIAVVSKHSAREKSIRHGHPSTLHLWWARRPLGACRSMLMALLLPDPEDQHCPAEFKTAARSLLGKTTGKIGAKDADLRAALLHFIGDFADWDNSSNRTYLEIARGLVKAAHPEETPLVVDPFAGGGSIPLEALRLGCDAFASDLNPVACLINKVLLEDIPRHGPELAEELRRVGAEVKKAAERELAEFYPQDTDGARPIAYLWARTVRCEAPNCGAEIPLMRSFWLCKKAERRRALRTKVVRPPKGDSHVELEVFTPKTEKDVRSGTVSRAKASCVCCNSVLHPDRVRTQLREQRGGADVVFDAKGHRTAGARLLAVVMLRPGEPGRYYRLPTEPDYQAVRNAQQRLTVVAKAKLPGGLSPIPDEPTPAGGGSGAGRAFSVQKYGMMQWGDLFTARQKVALLLHISICQTAVRKQKTPYTRGLSIAIAATISKMTDTNSVICTWLIDPPRLRATFSRQALSTTWDFAETCPLSDTAGNHMLAVGSILEVLENSSLGLAGNVEQADAVESPLPDQATSVWFTDPPYYDAVPYADLADYFLVWMRRTFLDDRVFRNRLETEGSLSLKDREIVQDDSRQVEGAPKDQMFFERKIALAFGEGRRITKEGGIGCVVFAHKTTEGWEALLSGLIRGGWVIRGSWPIATELESRQRARDSAALATSVHLICRPRPEDAPIGDWGQVLRELPKRVADWMTRLQEEGVRGADLVFACIGPALEVYSRYSKVVDAEEREIPLGGNPEAREAHQRGFLAYVWEVVGRAALEEVLGTAEAKARNGAAGALEEDARLTALFLWTLQATTQDAELVTTKDDEDIDAEQEDDDAEHAPSTKKKKGLSLPFDVARRFAQPLGIHLDAWEGRCIETEKGVVRLVPVLDRAEQLFGEDGAGVVADRLEKHRTGPIQATLFPLDDDPTPTPIKGRRRKGAVDVSDESLHKHRGATTLDHVHAAMLLQSSGRANALRALLKAETERGPDFLRLANALSALYPKDSNEKRLVDAMLLAVPR